MVVVSVEGTADAGAIQIELPSDGTDAGDFYDDEQVRGARERVVKLARPLFAEAMDLVQSCAGEIKAKMDAMPDDVRPDEVEVQFQVKLDAKVGAMIAEFTQGAQLQISLRWNRDA
ncbi:CU044_2847 family protein [Nonomuraea endophytica]|uniref:CU044_2847 family protein n=1 Tax=Nonomuraea endophytica TaxID=714136 RepID=UPI0037CA4D5A